MKESNECLTEWDTALLDNVDIHDIHALKQLRDICFFSNSTEIPAVRNFTDGMYINLLTSMQTCGRALLHANALQCQDLDELEQQLRNMSCENIVFQEKVSALDRSISQKSSMIREAHKKSKVYRDICTKLALKDEERKKTVYSSRSSQTLTMNQSKPTDEKIVDEFKLKMKKEFEEELRKIEAARKEVELLKSDLTKYKEDTRPTISPNPSSFHDLPFLLVQSMSHILQRRRERDILKSFNHWLLYTVHRKQYTIKSDAKHVASFNWEEIGNVDTAEGVPLEFMNGKCRLASIFRVWVQVFTTNICDTLQKILLTVYREDSISTLCARLLETLATVSSNKWTVGRVLVNNGDAYSEVSSKVTDLTFAELQSLSFDVISTGKIEKQHPVSSTKKSLSLLKSKLKGKERNLSIASRRVHKDQNRVFAESIEQDIGGKLEALLDPYDASDSFAFTMRHLSHDSHFSKSHTSVSNMDVSTLKKNSSVSSMLEKRSEDTLEEFTSESSVKPSSYIADPTPAVAAPKPEEHVGEVKPSVETLKTYSSAQQDSDVKVSKHSEPKIDSPTEQNFQNLLDALPSEE